MEKKLWFSLSFIWEDQERWGNSQGFVVSEIPCALGYGLSFSNVSSPDIDLLVLLSYRYILKSTKDNKLTKLGRCDRTTELQTAELQTAELQTAELLKLIILLEE